MMEVDDWSSGYYRLSMHVEPYHDGPTISCELSEFIESEYYCETNTDPLFRLDLDGSPYFHASCEYTIPEDTLGVPEAWFDDTNISRSFGEAVVYLLKPSYASMLDESFEFETLDFDDVLNIDGWREYE